MITASATRLESRSNREERQPSSALPAPYNTPPPDETRLPSASTLALVETQVEALLAASPSYHSLATRDQQKLRNNLVRLGAHVAELIRLDWYKSLQLGQTPMLRRREIVPKPARVATSQAAGDDLRPAAASQIGRITRDTLNAVAFPTFVADLIHSTFNAITDSSVRQLEAYTRLLDNVNKTVDQFENNSVSDKQAHAWLADMYPNHLRLQDGQAVPQPNADELPKPDFGRDLNVGSDITIDETSIEETLVPAARRKMAQNRLQILSTMVLMGMNRIVVTGGKIRATMGFHIDTTDRAHEESATDFEFRHSGQFQIGYGWIGGSASHSIAYVSSKRANSDSEINVDTDLTGEVEIHFKSEAFPLQRFADNKAIGQIRANTAVPDENTPPGQTSGGSANPLGDTPSVGGNVGKYQSQRSRRSQRQAPAYRPIGTPLPDASRPVAPDAVQGNLLRESSRVNTQGPQQGSNPQPNAGGDSGTSDHASGTPTTETPATEGTQAGEHAESSEDK